MPFYTVTTLSRLNSINAIDVTGCWEYLRYILGISLGYFGDILGTFLGYFGDILGISWGYFEDILGIFW